MCRCLVEPLNPSFEGLAGQLSRFVDQLGVAIAKSGQVLLEFSLSSGNARIMTWFAFLLLPIYCPKVQSYQDAEVLGPIDQGGAPLGEPFDVQCAVVQSTLSEARSRHKVLTSDEFVYRMISTNGEAIANGAEVLVNQCVYTESADGDVSIVRVIGRKGEVPLLGLRVPKRRKVSENHVFTIPQGDPLAAGRDRAQAGGITRKRPKNGSAAPCPVGASSTPSAVAPPPALQLPEGGLEDLLVGLAETNPEAAQEILGVYADLGDEETLEHGYPGFDLEAELQHEMEMDEAITAEDARLVNAIPEDPSEITEAPLPSSGSGDIPRPEVAGLVARTLADSPVGVPAVPPESAAEQPPPDSMRDVIWTEPGEGGLVLRRGQVIGTVSAWGRTPQRTADGIFDNFSIKCRLHVNPPCKTFCRSARVGMQRVAEWLAAGEEPPEGATLAERTTLRNRHEAVPKPTVR